MGRRHSFGQTVRTTGVVGHVAPDRATLLATRIRCEMQTEASHVSGEVEIQDTGLHPGQARRHVDVEDAVHLGGADDDRSPIGVAPPASPVPDPRATNGIPN